MRDIENTPKYTRFNCNLVPKSRPQGVAGRRPPLAEYYKKFNTQVYLQILVNYDLGQPNSLVVDYSRWVPCFDIDAKLTVMCQDT